MVSTRSSFPIMTQFRKERDPVISCETSINMYLIPAETNKEKKVLVPASGFDIPLPIGMGDIRASFVFKEHLYVVSGAEVYEIDVLLLPTLLLTLATTIGYVGISANENQVIFVDGADAWVWDTVASTVTPVVFGFPISPVDVTMLDFYFIIPDGNKNQWYISALNDGTTWNVLDFANFSSVGDQLVGVRTLKRRVYLFGHISTEIWFDAGVSIFPNTNFPFRRDNSSLFEHGCAAPKTIRENFELLFYLATNKEGAAGVMMAAGSGNPQKISTPEVDLFLQNLTSLSDSDAILYRENGIVFYQLSFTTDNKTLLFVLNTQSWHELAMPDGSRHRANTHSFFINKHFIGMYDSNQLYELSYKYMTYAGELIRCQIVSAPFFDENNKRIRVDRFELETIPGLPDATWANQQINPELSGMIEDNLNGRTLLFISRDGGRTFGNGIWATNGRLGQYLMRTIWRRLGCQRARRWVFKIEYPYFTYFYVLGANIIYEVLPQ